MRNDLDEGTVFAAIASAVGALCDVDVRTLRPDTSVAELDIDSMTAAEILIQVQGSLDVEIDLRRVAGDWSQMTLGSLGAEVVASVVGPAS